MLQQGSSHGMEPASQSLSEQGLFDQGLLDQGLSDLEFGKASP